MKELFLVGILAIVNMLFLPSREFYCNLGPERPKPINVLKRKTSREDGFGHSSNQEWKFNKKNNR